MLYFSLVLVLLKYSGYVILLVHDMRHLYQYGNEQVSHELDLLIIEVRERDVQ